MSSEIQWEMERMNNKNHKWEVTTYQQLAYTLIALHTFHNQSNAQVAAIKWSIKRGSVYPFTFSFLLALQMQKSDDITAGLAAFAGSLNEIHRSDVVVTYKPLIDRVKSRLDPLLARELLIAANATKNATLIRDVLIELPQDTVLEDLYDLGIDAAFRAGNPTQALEHYETLERSLPIISAHTHSIMIRGYAKTQQLPAALNHFRLLLLHQMHIDNALAVNALIDSCIKFNNLSAALEVFDHQKTHTSTIDVITFSTIV